MALATYAIHPEDSRGRRHAQPSHPYRNEYARDRDRVIHARAFRRLEAKTQVFTTRYSDHFRNRLTHTLEVTQIARTVAGALHLNSDLAEALALVHDIGHPPFGHAGERVLDARMREHGETFDHNLHALRIVEKFEERYLDFSGLNLTYEVREGIIKHSHDYDPLTYPELAEYALDVRPPLEAQLIDLVDEIAYNTADLDDGFEAHLIDLRALRKASEIFDRFYGEVLTMNGAGKPRLLFTEVLKRILDFLASDVIQETQQRLNEIGAISSQDIREYPTRLVSYSTRGAEYSAQLKRYLNSCLYELPAITKDRERSVKALDMLFEFFLNHPERMPGSYWEQIKLEPLYRVVCDYIAGMTDNFLLRQYREQVLRAPREISLRTLH
jgi:dGTPase